MIRSYLQYYNKNNILITEAHLTFKNYRSTSMWLDILGIFPFRLLTFDQMFFDENSFYLGYHYHILASRTFQVYRIFGALNYISEENNNKWIKLAIDLIWILIWYWLIQLIFVCLFIPRVCDINEVK